MRVRPAAQLWSSHVSKMAVKFFPDNHSISDFGEWLLSSRT